MSKFNLVADIGGTNARFALSDDKNIHHIHTLACADFPHIEDAIRRFFTLCQLNIGDIRSACIAIANPITGDQVKMTNHHWSFFISKLKKDLQFEQLLVINDFTAQALSILSLSDNQVLSVRQGICKANEPIAVIGPGTGLGISGLIPVRDHWHALTSEGGHVSFSPHNDQEYSIWKYAQNIYGHVSAERLICGAGLSLIDAALSEAPPYPDTWRYAAEITEAAAVGEELALETLSLFISFLATVTSNLVLTLGARGGVYLCGGILPRISNYLVESSPFNQRFLDKGRFEEYLKDIPVWLVIADNPGLQGASEALKQLL